MFNSLNKILSPPIFPDDEEKTRAAELLNTVLIALTLLFFIALIALILGGSGLYRVYTVVGIFAFVLAILQFPLRQGYVRQVGYLTILIVTAVLTYALINGGTVRAPGVILFTLTIIISGLVLGRRAGYWTAAINTIIFITILWLEINGKLPEPLLGVNIQQAIVFAGNAAMVAILLGLALRRMNESLEQARSGKNQLSKLNAELEQRVEERTEKLAESTEQIQRRATQLEAIANTARSAATIQNLDQLLPAITRDISARFGYYHVSIFLLDENREYAILSAANSQGGQNMLSRGHRLKVGEQGMVGYVTASGNPRIALDVGQDAIFFNNPDLPETHSEVSLPLRFGQEIIGALDIQSTEANAFSQSDMEIFSILADQVSIAIQNARSLEQVQRALQGMESTSRHAVGQSWQSYTETIKTRGYRYDGLKPEPIKMSSKSTEDKNALSIPVQLRGQSIGHLKLRAIEQSHEWTEDELAIIESTAERVAIALEGARLLDDAQKRASRETFLSEMATKLGASFQLDSILRDTVEELGQTLKGSKVTFQLVDPSAPPKVNDAGGNGTAGKKRVRHDDG